MLNFITLLEYFIAIFSLLPNLYGFKDITSLHGQGKRQHRLHSSTIAIVEEYEPINELPMNEKNHPYLISANFDTKSQKSGIINNASTLLMRALTKDLKKFDAIKNIENYVNILEQNYVPIHTKEYFNLAIGGTWKLCFSYFLEREDSSPEL